MVQDLSSSAEQFEIGDNKGFDSNASGIVFGFDYPVRDGAATVGFALALNDSNVVSRGASLAPQLEFQLKLICCMGHIN